MRILSTFAAAMLLALTMASVAAAQVRPGVEVLVDYYADRLAGKRVGLLTNPTGVDTELKSTIDLINALPNVTLVRLFAPEHGVRGGHYAGAQLDDARDPVSGLPVVSLHGTSRRPPAESLQGLDIVLYDIQDVGNRTYTFVSSLTYMMEACAQAGVEVWVLDRPCPMGGTKVGGPMLESGKQSFIGVHNIAQSYGMTPGEFARLIRAERVPTLRLTVIPMQGWKRGMTYGELGWPWVPPSEHIPHWQTSFFYTATGSIGELGRVSNGVGTPLPFEQIGAPWMDGTRLAASLNSAKLPGAHFRPTVFKPRYGTFSGEFCNGVQIHITDASAFDPSATANSIYRAIVELYPQRQVFRADGGNGYQMFVKSIGDQAMLDALASGDGAALARLANSQANSLEYLERRAKYLIYE